MKPGVYLNGETVPEDKARVSVFDRGLSYGDGLYETLKAVEGRPLFLKEHLVRLRAGARFLGLGMSALRAFEDDIKKGAIEALLNGNGLSRGEAYVKLMVTRGADRAGHLPARGVKPTFIIIAKPLDAAWLARIRVKGVGAVLVDGIAPALPGVKTLNCLPSVLARMRADRAGAFEAIFVKDGHITEGGSSNVFVVKRGKIATPPLARDLSSGVLAGVARAEVLRSARENGTPARERPVRANELASADEAFITNSIIDIVPLVKAAGRPIKDGRPGPVTARLRSFFKYKP